MKVSQVMSKKPITIIEDATLVEAAKVLIKKKISGAPVIDKRKKLVGVISEKDLFKALYPSYQDYYDDPSAWLDPEEMEKKAQEAANKKIKELMTKKIISVTSDTPVMRVGAIMLARGIQRVLVVDGGELRGLVSRRDIYQKVLKKQLNI